MSGSDPSVTKSGPSGSGVGGAGGGGGCPDPFETVLASPDPDIVDGLAERELLDVLKVDTPIRGVVATLLTGEIVGAITQNILALRKCLDDGVAYEAEVVRIVGGAITVIVRPA
jgi:hypothetical protein